MFHRWVSLPIEHLDFAGDPGSVHFQSYAVIQMATSTIYLILLYIEMLYTYIIWNSDDIL